MVPAKAGTRSPGTGVAEPWIPAWAGMTAYWVAARTRAREAEKDQDQRLDLPQFRLRNAANSSEDETRRPKFPANKEFFAI
jgi:hypothetical protein